MYLVVNCIDMRQFWVCSLGRELRLQRATLLDSFSEVKDSLEFPIVPSNNITSRGFHHPCSPNASLQLTPGHLFAARFGPTITFSSYRPNYQSSTPSINLSPRPSALPYQCKPFRGKSCLRCWTIKQELVPIIRTITRHPAFSLSLHHVNALRLASSELRK